jgi:hypothetical protein
MAGKQSALAPTASELRKEARSILDRLQATANRDEKHRSAGRAFEGGEIAVSDPDLLRAARFMIDKYGAHAALMAAKRAQDLIGAGQLHAAAIWIRVGIAAAQILSEPRN